MNSATTGSLWELSTHTAAAYALSPYFVLWAVSLLGIISGSWGSLWLFFPAPLARTARRIWPGDLVWGWLAVAAAHHLMYLNLWQDGFGQPLGLWLLVGALALLLILRILPNPFRRPERLFILSILVWGAVLVAGENYLVVVEADRYRLANAPESVLDDPATLYPLLHRTLYLRRLEGSTRTAILAVLESNPSGASVLSDGGRARAALLSFRLQALPALLERYGREQVRLRTYQWMQMGLMAASLLAWGLGAPLLRNERNTGA